MHTIRGFLTRRANGLYLLSGWLPEIARVGNTDRQDAYPVPGDPLTFINVCEWAAEQIWGVKDLPPLETVRVEVRGRKVE